MGTTAFNEDGVEFFDLSLSTSEGTELKNKKILNRKISYAALSKLAGTLILAILQKFHNTALVGGETDNFTDQTADEDEALGRLLQ